MNKVFLITIACVFILGAGNSYAGLFARGGGESRTITSVSPDSVFNKTRQMLVLHGRFSKKQSRDRRVVIYGRRTHHGIRIHTVQQLQAAAQTVQVVRPVHVTHWGGHRIQVVIPAHLTPGTYYIYLERDFHHHGQHQWRTISNKKVFTVKAARTMGQIRGRYESSICNTPPQRLFISGGPFKSGGRHPQALNIHAEIQAPVHTSSLLPTLRVISNTQILALVPPCLSTHRDTKLRLAYPNGTKSNWIPIEQMWAR